MYFFKLKQTLSVSCLYPPTPISNRPFWSMSTPKWVTTASIGDSWPEISLSSGAQFCLCMRQAGSARVLIMPLGSNAQLMTEGNWLTKDHLFCPSRERSLRHVLCAASQSPHGIMLQLSTEAASVHLISFLAFPVLLPYFSINVSWGHFAINYIKVILVLGLLLGKSNVSHVYVLIWLYIYVVKKSIR